ncbi:hypothetical protein KP509_11G039400 [Ceratopteris richardii]|uniref:Oberon-like PHD finger domain-containing protein n=1 Tax=Ceratopteris richardii TaxID=49495 RepID=A0A8T2TX67_CERRI|nr:hypothetical protein KP509_11G039400 [Ceratopteris richardii]
MNGHRKQELVSMNTEEYRYQITPSRYRLSLHDNNISDRKVCSSYISSLSPKTFGDSNEFPGESTKPLEEFCMGTVKMKSRSSLCVLETSRAYAGSNFSICNEENNLPRSPFAGTIVSSAAISVAEPPVPFLKASRQESPERRNSDKTEESEVNCIQAILLQKQETEADSEGKDAVQTENKPADGQGRIQLPTNAGASDPFGKSNGSHMATDFNEEDEKEEGELETDDEIIDNYACEVRNEMARCEDLEIQIEGKIQDYDNQGSQSVCKATKATQQLESDQSYSELAFSTADGSKDTVDTMRPHDDSKSYTFSSSDSWNKREQEIDHNGICGKVFGENEEGMGDLIDIDLKSSHFCSSDLMENINQTEASLCTDSDASLERNSICQPVESSLHDTLVRHQIHEELDNTSTIQDMHMQGDSHIQVDIMDITGSPGLVEEMDEICVSAQKHDRQKIEPLQLSLALPECLSGSFSFNPEVTKPLDTQRHSQNSSNFRTESKSHPCMYPLSFSSFVYDPSCSLTCIYHEDQELSSGGNLNILQQKQPRSGEDAKGLHDISNRMTHELRSKSVTPTYEQMLEIGKPANAESLLPLHILSSRDRENNNISVRNHMFTSWSTAFPIQGRLHITESQNFSEVQEPFSEISRGMEGRGISYVKLGLHEIVSAPVIRMAQMLQELPDSFMDDLKGLASELLGNFEKQEEFLALQEIIKTRKDLTEYALLRAHPAQLQILVALKTGMQSFVQYEAENLTYKALIEIFFQTKCRNVKCQLSLPVNGCECKICSKQKGFCHECMCMICFKFDVDTKTTHWIGCDVCMHWCHTDCGMRISCIRSAPVSGNSIQTHEMQFQCLSCGHYLELYGFVKFIFENFAYTWDALTLAKELDCVWRIFHGIKAGRGKQLLWKVEETLHMLERNAAINDVRSTMLSFFGGKTSVKE